MVHENSTCSKNAVSMCWEYYINFQDTNLCAGVRAGSKDSCQGRPKDL